MPTDAKPRARHGIRAPLAAKKAHWISALLRGTNSKDVNSQSFHFDRKEKASAFFNLEHHRTTDAHTSRVLDKEDTGADKHLHVH